MKVLSLWFAVLVVLALTQGFSNASEISGSYKCNGTDPDGVTYTGKVTIAKTGESYSVKWTIDGDTHSGTGILTDKVFSASWVIGDTNEGGIVVYKIDESGTLEGRWLGLGEDALNRETLTPNK